MFVQNYSSKLLLKLCTHFNMYKKHQYSILFDKFELYKATGIFRQEDLVKINVEQIHTEYVNLIVLYINKYKLSKS